ncbi:hypothetical protein BYT27DRAFT_7263452 [Phlegmacium glaucopus]|nr:hypothetical protein BYT27DRAFT_7263452 [Phlegmacium glaucopus]
MANGIIIPSLATWKGKMQLEGVCIEGEFEIFDSNGSWAFLLGKPLLWSFRAKHNYVTDTVEVSDNTTKALLINKITKARVTEPTVGMNLTLDMKQQVLILGGSSEAKSPPREVYVDKDSNVLLNNNTNKDIEPAPAPKTIYKLPCPPNNEKPSKIEPDHQESWQETLTGGAKYPLEGSTKRAL